jgi:hypothetical protein
VAHAVKVVEETAVLVAKAAVAADTVAAAIAIVAHGGIGMAIAEIDQTAQAGSRYQPSDNTKPVGEQSPTGFSPAWIIFKSAQHMVSDN